MTSRNVEFPFPVALIVNVRSLQVTICFLGRTGVVFLLVNASRPDHASVEVPGSMHTPQQPSVRRFCFSY